jgi:deoxyribodipyrimidine photo-lyase
MVSEAREPVTIRHHGFASREDRVAYLIGAFPEEARRDRAVSPIAGGRRAALSALGSIDPDRYARSRNDLDGAVTRLSPYVRHGVLDLAELRDAVLARTGGDAGHKLINELAWRDYFQRVYRAIGDRVWSDVEPSKVVPRGRMSEELPEDLLAGRTGLACIDAFIRELHETGYLHNHARMWLAAYLVHWRRVRWRAGAEWFLTHLLDGDPASNNLSWQWVASTFSHKPYLFNRENLERHSGGVYCQDCQLFGRCDFEGDYEAIERRLFARRGPPVHSSVRLRSDEPPRPESSGEGAAIVWVNDDDLNPVGPALTAEAGAPAIHVWDDETLARRPMGLKRVVFLSECLAELPVEDRRGDLTEVIHDFATEHAATRVVTTESPDPRIEYVKRRLGCLGLRLETVGRRPFVRLEGPIDLIRFSRYWGRASKALARHRPLDNPR